MSCPGGNPCIPGNWCCDKDDCHPCWFEEGERMMMWQAKQEEKPVIKPPVPDPKEWKTKYSKKEWKELQRNVKMSKANYNESKSTLDEAIRPYIILHCCIDFFKDMGVVLCLCLCLFLYFLTSLS